jgi:hypothetical protein
MEMNDGSDSSLASVWPLTPLPALEGKNMNHKNIPVRYNLLTTVTAAIALVKSAPTILRDRCDGARKFYSEWAKMRPTDHLLEQRHVLVNTNGCGHNCGHTHEAHVTNCDCLVSVATDVFLPAAAMYMKGNFMARVSKKEAINYIFYGVVPNHAREELIRLNDGNVGQEPEQCSTCPFEMDCFDGNPPNKAGYRGRPCELYRHFEKGPARLCDVNFESINLSELGKTWDLEIIEDAELD